MALSDLLQRLRPAGAPGAAGPVAVPAQDEERAAAELAPVFDALAPVLAECEAIRLRAAQQAEAETADAQRAAAAVVSDAAARLSAERAAAAAAVRRSGDATANALLGEAREAAAELHETGRARMAALVGRVLAGLRSDLGAPELSGLTAAEPQASELSGLTSGNETSNGARR